MAAVGEWQHGLLGCFDNIGVCLFSYFLPCYQFGKNAEAVGDDCCICGLLFMVPVAGCIFHYSNRGKIREINAIEGDCCTDALYTIFCVFCALAQEAQECDDLHKEAAEEGSMARH